MLLDPQLSRPGGQVPAYAPHRLPRTVLPHTEQILPVAGTPRGPHGTAPVPRTAPRRDPQGQLLRPYRHPQFLPAPPGTGEQFQIVQKADPFQTQDHDPAPRGPETALQRGLPRSGPAPQLPARPPGLPQIAHVHTQFHPSHRQGPPVPDGQTADGLLPPDRLRHASGEAHPDRQTPPQRQYRQDPHRPQFRHAQGHQGQGPVHPAHEPRGQQDQDQQYGPHQGRLPMRGRRTAAPIPRTIASRSRPSIRA